MPLHPSDDAMAGSMGIDVNSSETSYEACIHWLAE